MNRRVFVVSSALVMLFGVMAGTAIAQDAPPGTDVYLAKIGSGADGGATLSDLRNLTDRDGYDNQPSTSEDGGTVFYTSIRAGSDGSSQADIYAFDLDSGATHQVTDTATSEYSPTPIPGEDAISVVRVESDGETQRLWRFPIEVGGKAGEPSLILEKIQPVGYHAWLVDGAEGQRRELVLFVLDEPHRLVRTGAVPEAEGRTVASDIGRALHRIPGEDAFSFVHKSGDDWTITRVDASNDELTPLFPTFAGREDLTWSADGFAWMADGRKLYRRQISDEDWKLVADLSDQLPGDVTRLAVSPDSKTLALVANR